MSANGPIWLQSMHRLAQPNLRCLGICGSGMTGEYTENMDYSVGSRIRVRLYSGKVVEAEITAITNQSTGRKLQIVYGNVTASINPAQITEVLPTS
jgi:hypothetical protein